MLQDLNLKAGATKIFMGLEEVDFLGFKLTAGKIAPDDKKTAAISRLLPPRTRTEVRAFLGLTGYYREFIWRYSLIARPLTSLLKDDTIWQWTDACLAAFEQLKTALTSAPILSVPDPHRPFQVHTDYSHVAVGAILE